MVIVLQNPNKEHMSNIIVHRIVVLAFLWEAAVHVFNFCTRNTYHCILIFQQLWSWADLALCQLINKKSTWSVKEEIFWVVKHFPTENL